MNRTISSVAIPVAIGVALAGIVLLAYLSHKKHGYVSKEGGRGVSGAGRPPIPAEGKDAPPLDAMLERLGRRALAFAIYDELLNRGTRKSIKDKLYAKYGYVNLPPSLEEDDAIETCPQVMTDNDFLSALNRWIVANGGLAKSGFFSAATESGRIMVEAKRAEARQIVDKADVA